MRVYEKNDDLILCDVSSFDLFHTFDCGQCFRWNYEEDGFSGVAFGEYLHICKRNGKIILKDHMEHCIVDAVQENDREALTRLSQAIDRFVR